ncbi:MAG: pantetheine-phosphate adenylyltransferase [Bacteroidales bacterium]|nr:pantetheine-phosphate adenylyltransferase [Bacteroidales bacterium]
MEKIAVFPGSFDPFTAGHESIVRRAMNLFDKIIVAIGININKQDFFPLDMRMQLIKDVFAMNNQIVVDKYQCLTVEYCKQVKADYILRGVRTSSDFEYERAYGQVNKSLNNDIETIFLLTNPEHSFINSSIVRDIIRNGGDASSFLPANIDINKYIKV